MIIIDIPARFNRGMPSIYEPRVIQPTQHYGIRFPGAHHVDLPTVDRAPMIDAAGKDHPNAGEWIGYAKSNIAPMLTFAPTIGTETHWSALMERAKLFRLPLDILLTRRPLRIGVEVITVQNYGPFRHGPRDILTLRAIEIGGDFTKDEALEARIAEIDSWFA